MSEYLLEKYRPVANSLLSRNHLSVPDATRDMLAKRIMHSRMLTPVDKGQLKSPNEGLRRALLHAVTLLKYAQQGASKRDSVKKRSAKLHSSLMVDGVALAIGLSPEGQAAQVNIGLILDALKKFDASAPILVPLIGVLEPLIEGHESSATGRPWALKTYIVRSGCIAWKKAGRLERFSWSEVHGKLSGPLPDFLRDLISCCNGTCLDVVRLESSYADGLQQLKPVLRKKVTGDRAAMNDKSLHMAIINCQKGGLI